jgi:hypothetical protein
MFIGIGTGELDGLGDAARLVETDDVHHPGATDYDRKYRAFRDLTDCLEGVWEEHRTLRRG